MGDFLQNLIAVSGLTMSGDDQPCGTYSEDCQPRGGQEGLDKIFGQALLCT